MAKAKKLILSKLPKSRHITGQVLASDIAIDVTPDTEEALFGPSSYDDITYSKEIADSLARHYPGHSWLVRVDHAQGTAVIKNQMLSEKWGYVKHLNNVMVKDLDKWARTAGGEFLERYKIDRKRMEPGSYENVSFDLLHQKNPNRPPEA